MKKCYGSVSFSILLNGESINYFKSSRDLRQGDPLSPFLFLIVSEAFDVMFAKAFHGELLEEISIGRKGVVVLHLHFADDTLMLCRGSANQMSLCHVSSNASN